MYFRVSFLPRLETLFIILKEMKKLYICLILLLLSTSAFAQIKRKSVSKSKPAKETIIFKDENGENTDKNEFSERGGFSNIKDRYEETVVNGKTIEIKLKKNLRENLPFSDFTATTIDGKTIDTKQLRGKVLVIDFWFISCVGCVAEIPRLNKLRAKFKDNENVVFLALTFDEGARLSKFLKEKPFNFQHIAGENTFIDTYKYDESFPVNIIVGKDGMIVRWQYGIYNLSRFEGRIQAELDKP
jgi:peroxiredoxin